MTKRGNRALSSIEAKLRKRICIRIVEIWQENDHCDKLGPYGVQAINYLKSIGYIPKELPKEEPNTGEASHLVMSPSVATGQDDKQ